MWKLYPVFFTSRDKEPSLSSSEEKSSEFDWLERKITRKKIYIRKTEQVLYIFLHSQNCTKDYYMIDICSIYVRFSFVKEITNYL